MNPNNGQGASQHTPEPNHVKERWQVKTWVETPVAEIYDASGFYLASCIEKEIAENAVNCHNACRDMADPAKEIQAMRERIKELEAVVEKINPHDIYGF